MQFKNASDHIPQVVILAALIGLVNSFIKPVLGILSFPINAMTLGLFGVVVNGLLLLLIACVANTWFDIPFTIAGFPDKALSIDAVIAAIVAVDRDGPHHHGHRARRPRLGGELVTPDALRAAARRFGTPVYVTSAAALDDAAAELRDAFPDPWLRAFSVKANDVPAIIARLGARGARRRTSSRRGEWAAATAGRHRATTGSRSRGSARPPPTSGRRCGPRADGDPLRWVAVESPEELDGAGGDRPARRARQRRPAAARRPAPPQPGRRRPRPTPAWPSVAGPRSSA